MAQFRAAESFGMNAAGFLALEGGFLRGAEPQPSAHHVEIRRGLERRQRRRPIERPSFGPSAPAMCQLPTSSAASCVHAATIRAIAASVAR